MKSLNFKIEVFEGPLDLMLHLISKHKLNINDIPISQLLEQYLKYISGLKEANLEITSEFLTMAARLVYIKTLSLLPKHEEADELKKEIQGQLIEYQQVKDVAQMLNKRSLQGLILVREPQQFEKDYSYEIMTDKQLLVQALKDAAGKSLRKLPPTKEAFSGIVEHKVVSVESRMLLVLEQLYGSGRVWYKELFEGLEKSEKVATFLAVLELIKSKQAEITSDNRELVYVATTERTDDLEEQDG